MLKPIDNSVIRQMSVSAKCSSNLRLPNLSPNPRESQTSIPILVKTQT